MMSFLEFTFKSFWHFVGVFILLGGLMSGILRIYALTLLAFSKTSSKDIKEVIESDTDH